MSKEQNSLFAASPYFVSSRTHFNFITRFFIWIAKFSTGFADLIKSFVSLIPFWGSAMKVLGTSLDALAFGSNQSFSSISRSIALYGYGSLMVCTIIGFFFPPLASLKLLTSASIFLGMFFEAQTIVNWFQNYKELETQKLFNEEYNQENYDNALTMVNASIITFISMACKAFALSLSIYMPTTSIFIFIIAQTAEIGAMIGSIGKEKVNIDQNISSLKENETLDSSYSKLQQKLPSLSIEHSPKTINKSQKHSDCLNTPEQPIILTPKFMDDECCSKQNTLIRI